MAATAESSPEVDDIGQTQLEEVEGELSYLLDRLGAELEGEDGSGAGAGASREDDENDTLLENEENVKKLFSSLEKAGKLMDLIDVRADKLLEKMDKIILEMDPVDDDVDGVAGDAADRLI